MFDLEKIKILEERVILAVDLIKDLREEREDLKVILQEQKERIELLIDENDNLKLDLQEVLDGVENSLSLLEDIEEDSITITAKNKSTKEVLVEEVYEDELEYEEKIGSSDVDSERILVESSVEASK